ncbi:FAD:protein FMN transferase [Methyloprofundus sp.]|uniref:FAD:protein FMN transferase n=1 Tax=Methyloprofundus sp. TaxID=2020875 RepID=UPI003D1370E8
MKYFKYQFKAMGTPCEIQLYAESESHARETANLVINDVSRLEGLYSRYREDSFLSQINRYAAKAKKITVDTETAGLLNYAATCYQQSDGLFDITSGKLRQAWRFDSGKIPAQNTINQLLRQIGWHQLDWNPPVLDFFIPGLEIDFGGIVKEYAVDRAASLCIEAGIYHGIINLGGDIKIIGPQADGSPWKVGIRHPRIPNAMLQTLSLTHGALASSGDYERFILVDGIRYSHVLNPKTGWPVRYMSSVSVVSDFCVVAGSASTIAMLKEEQGPEFLQDLALPHLWSNVLGKDGGSLMPGGVC